MNGYNISFDVYSNSFKVYDRDMSILCCIISAYYSV